jgi:thiol-disulfide isomerase/thioredoxin
MLMPVSIINRVNYMKRIIFWSMLLLPLTGICQQEESSVDLLELNLNEVIAFYSNDRIDQNELMRDYKALDAILKKDIGEVAMMKELEALDMVKDSLAFVTLVTTKPRRIVQKKKILKLEFVEKHPDSYISLYELEDNNDMYSADSYAAAYEKLSDRLKKLKAAEGIRKRIAALKKVSLHGKQAPDFTRKDQYGKTVKLSDYRGKFVILDFWGSWCGACRQSHPQLKELYEAYKDKGLEIVAVANEQMYGEKGKAIWHEAIEKDSVNWVHVLNDEGIKKMDIIKAYQISNYPTKFLLDRNGKILLRISGLLNVEIDQMIESVLGK